MHYNKQVVSAQCHTYQRPRITGPQFQIKGLNDPFSDQLPRAAIGLNKGEIREIDRLHA